MNRALVKGLALGAVTAFLSAAAHAQLTTFAQFTQSGGTRPFTFTNAGAGSTFTLTAPISVNFVFQVYNDYNGSSFATTIPAMMTLTSTVAGNVQTLGGFRNQPLTGITMTFTAVTPVNGKSNLLTVVANAGGDTSGGSIIGAVNSSAAGFSGSQAGASGDAVAMTSDFVSFAATTQRDYSISLNAVTQPIATSSGYLRSFTADGAGTFASDPAPFANVPEPASIALLALGGLALRRRRRH